MKLLMVPARSCCVSIDAQPNHEANIEEWSRSEVDDLVGKGSSATHLRSTVMLSYSPHTVQNILKLQIRSDPVKSLEDGGHSSEPSPHHRIESSMAELLG